MVALGSRRRPHVLIADEPTTALDVTTQAQILELIARLQRERDLAVILITHDMGVIAEMGGRCRGDVSRPRGRERSGRYDLPRAAASLHTVAAALDPSVLAEPRARLATISGSIPHPLARPAGCPFHPRCPDRIRDVAMSMCRRKVSHADDHVTACHLYTELVA